MLDKLPSDLHNPTSFVFEQRRSHEQYKSIVNSKDKKYDVFDIKMCDGLVWAAISSSTSVLKSAADNNKN